MAGSEGVKKKRIPLKLNSRKEDTKMALITISRSMGGGGMSIARNVAEELKMDLYDDQRLQEEAVKMDFRSEDLKSLNERAPGLFDRILGNKPELYLDFMKAVVYEVAQRGHGVILGHGSQILLRDFGCALHVLIHATESNRIKHMMDQQGLSHEAAKKLIHKSDNEKKGFFRYAFHMDWNDPSLYDLIINTDMMGIDSAVKLITEAARSQKIKDCTLTAIDAMERLSQTNMIQATLLKNDFNLSMLHVEVPEKGLAHITGFSHSEEEKGHVVEIVKGVHGISEVQSEVGVMPAASY